MDVEVPNVLSVFCIDARRYRRQHRSAAGDRFTAVERAGGGRAGGEGRSGEVQDHGESRVHAVGAYGCF